MPAQVGAGSTGIEGHAWRQIMARADARPAPSSLRRDPLEPHPPPPGEPDAPQPPPPLHPSDVPRLSPITPAGMSAMHGSRIGAAESPGTTMPTIAVPAAPMPVQTA